MGILKDMGGWFKAEKKLSAHNPADRQQLNQLAERRKVEQFKASPAGQRKELQDLRDMKELSELRKFRDQQTTSSAIKEFCLNFPETNAAELAAGLSTMTAGQRDLMISVCNQAVKRLAEQRAEHAEMNRIMPDQLARAAEASQNLQRELDAMNPNNFKFQD